jgi:tetratricopeptide (TPR) repeat protein
MIARRFLRAGAILALACFGSAAQTKSPDACVPPPSGAAPTLPAHIMTGQGHVHFPITTSNPQAQEFFDQGIAQLHSFWAVEAERSFLQAAELDPEAPMPWFGVAMVAAGDYRPRFQLDLAKEVFGKDPRVTESRAGQAAQRALRLSQEPGKATELEKLYIAAVAARRSAKGGAADDAYIEGLRAIVAKYPREVEARTYLALHLMRGFTMPDHKPRPGTMEAVEILRALLSEAPEHPGVHHYVIHGWEGSSFASDAWPSCKRYAELVTNIPHALHMPGHIYSQTGKWDEAIQSFSSAAQLELGYMKADPLYGRGHHGHNVHYLATSYSFQGDYDHARQAALGLLELRENPREAAQVDGYFSAYRQGWFALLRAMVQSERWDEVLAGATLPVYDKPRETAWRHWAMSLAYAAKSDVEHARSEAAAMDAALQAYSDQVKLRPPAELRIARQELDAYIAAASGHVKDALTKLARASREQRAMTYSEPPYYPRPVAEAMGALALRHGMLKEAASAYREALEQYPADSHATAGLRRIAELSLTKPVESGQ